ncbi:MAG: YqgE/AlgH family protein [Neisseria sp.]|nr:YqgE/AlgH family protein [Neisseria sp.]
MAHDTATDFHSLSNHFLIAMPQLSDQFFGNSVVYVCEHTPDGAMGVIINKPSPVRMDQLFEAAEVPVPQRFAEQWVLMGGPVQIDRGFLVHSPVGSWQSSLRVNEDIAVTTSRDIIGGLSADENSAIKTFATIGYSGWGGGQLERELNDNHWLVIPADPHILFDLPYYRRYDAALDTLGIRAVNLAPGAGHA